MSLDGQIQALVARIRDEFNKDRGERTNSGFVNSIATSNVVLAGLQTIGGVAIGAGGRVLLVGQTDAKENGVWIVGSGAWARALDANTSARLGGYVATVSQGAAIGKTFRTTFKPTDVIGTNTVPWYRTAVEVVGSPLNFPVPTVDGNALFDKNSRMPTYWDAAGVQWLTGNGTLQDTKATRLAMSVPAKGLIFRETDTGDTYQWDGAGWQNISFAGTKTPLAYASARRVAAFNLPATTTLIPFDTEIADSTGTMFTPTSTDIIAPNTGRYVVDFNFAFANAGNNVNPSGSIFMSVLYINGVAQRYVERDAENGHGFSPTVHSGSLVLDLQAGDSVSLGIFVSTATTLYVASNLYQATLSMQQQATATVVQAVPVKSACQIYKTVAQNAPLSGAGVQITYDQIRFDNDSMADLANNRIVIPRDGIYTIKCCTAFAGNGSGNARTNVLQVNGVEVAVQRFPPMSTGGVYGVLAQIDLPLLAGDLITGVASQNSGVNLGLLVDTAYRCWISAEIMSDTVF